MATVTDSLHIASVTASALFLVVLPYRVRRIYQTTASRNSDWYGYGKACLSVALSIALFVYLYVVLHANEQIHKWAILSLCASFLLHIALSYVFMLERQRLAPPSDLTAIYLCSSISFDVMYLAMPTSAPFTKHSLPPIPLRCCAQLLLLALESYGGPLAVKSPNEHAAEDQHNLLSRLFLTWINPILFYGYRNILGQEDLPPLCEDMHAERTRQVMLQAWCQRTSDAKRSLPLALMTCLRPQFCDAILPRLFLIIFRYAQPPLIASSIRFVEQYPTATESSDGFWLIVAAIVTYSGIAFSTAIYQNRLNKLRLMTRSALTGLIHDKTMKSPSLDYEDGEATTLMSTDADALDGIAEMIHEIWAQVIEVAAGTALLAKEVGWIWPLPLLLICICSQMSRFVAKNLQPRQKKWNEATQGRIAATSSFLGSMKIVKMLGFQQHLVDRIQQLREAELLCASKLRWVMVYYNSSANALGLFSPAITLVLFAMVSVLRGGRLDTETAFTTMAILGLVTHPANMVMTMVPRLVAASAVFDRIQAYLIHPDLTPTPAAPVRLADGDILASANDNRDASLEAVIRMQHVQIGRSKVILKDINLDITSGSFNVVSGATGSGKSMLLRAILGEVPAPQGTIRISPRSRSMAYCSQKPWLPSGTVKNAIWGPCQKPKLSPGRQQDEDRYQQVVRLCCLEHDFQSLPFGDETQIGSQGLNLSGGQRQRVALARALFSECDLILLDDVFSGLDGETEAKIFENLFGSGGDLKNSGITVILVSNSTQFFSLADHIVLLGNHSVLEQGPWSRIKMKAAAVPKFSASTTSTAAGAALSSSFSTLNAQLQRKNEDEADLARQTGDTALYGYYLGFMNRFDFFFLWSGTLMCAFFMTIPSWWLKLWTEAGGSSSTFYLLGYLAIAFFAWMLTSLQMWSVLIRLAPQSGSRLHSRLLHVVSNAPLSYFSKTDNGSTLNRFSQDIQLIDKQLPSAMQTVITQFFKLLMQAAVLCLADPRLAISLPVCIVIVFVIQKLYLRTSRQLRFLELESRAEVFSNFLESVEGLETIRALGWSEAMMQANIRSVERSQRPEFLLMCLQRWLNLVLDLLVATIASGIVALAVHFRASVTGAQVGIALSIMLVANKTLLKLVESWTTLETSLGAISRVKTLEEMTPSEDRLSGEWQIMNWPDRGTLELSSVTATYGSESMALRNIDLSISAGQKVVVCGRTGSGKSTLLSAFLRLLELHSGEIRLDGINIRQVRVQALRQHCFITASQDALLLQNETLRFNLDPSTSVSNEVLIQALEKLGLWTHFSAASTTGAGYGAIHDPEGQNDWILDQKVSAFPQLSGGQFQLFSLSRALVKLELSRQAGIKPVVLLDELTSSLDTRTESAIHRIIDEEFTANGNTVVMVTHRLGNLERYMERGRDAFVLLQDGRLTEVIRDWGSTTLQKIEGLP